MSAAKLALLAATVVTVALTSLAAYGLYLNSLPHC